MPGGVRRAADYLEAALAEQGGPRIERVTLRGEGALLSSVPVYLGALARLGVWLTRRRVRLLHVNVTQRGSTGRALPLVLLARATRTPVVLHLHSSEYPAFLGSLPGPGRAAVRWMFRHADRVLVLGQGWAEFASSSLGVPPDRVWVVPNAVPGPPALAPRTSDGRVRVLFLGRLGARKGVGDLLSALGAAPVCPLPWEAVLAGDGDDAPFQAQARRLEVEERVRFTGWLDEAGVAAELRAADILALPSHAEGLPLALLEGLAHGLAVVTTPVGAIPEVVEDGENALLVAPGDTHALAAALYRLLCSPALRARLGDRARETWEQRYSTAAYGSRIREVYAGLGADEGR